LHVAKFELLAKAGKSGPSQALLVNGERFTFEGRFSSCELKPATSNREWVQSEFSGAARGVFLVQEIPLWQARNAPLAITDGALHIKNRLLLKVAKPGKNEIHWA